MVRTGDTPPQHSLSAARAAARLEDYERDLSKKVLPPSDPVEAFYKPIDPQAHSYHPRPPVGSIRLSSSGPTKLRVPRMFERYEQGHPRQEVDGAQNSAADMSASGAAQEPPLSPSSREYQKLRRWNLPKGEWLQTAESGHAPGPGYRDMAPTQSPRSCGPSARFSSGDLGGSSPSARLSPVPARKEAQRGDVRRCPRRSARTTARAPPASPSSWRGAGQRRRPARRVEGDETAAAAAAAVPSTATLPLELFDSPDGTRPRRLRDDRRQGGGGRARALPLGAARPTASRRGGRARCWRTRRATIGTRRSSSSRGSTRASRSGRRAS